MNSNPSELLYIALSGSSICENNALALTECVKASWILLYTLRIISS